MELRQLKYFLKAKELLNFTEAASSLHISQSTLSQQIKQLEDELDIPLFNRIGKRIAITEAGELFSEYAAYSVKKAKEGEVALKDLKELRTGKMSVGVTYGMRSALTTALIQFLQKYPQIKIQVFFGTSEELTEKLNKSELDFIIAFNEDKLETQFKYQVLYTSPMALIVSNTSSLADKGQITLKEIASLPLVLPDKGYNTIKFIQDVFKKKNLSPDVSVEINDIPTLLALVKTGNWHTILTQTTIRNETGLSAIPIDGKNMIKTAMIISLKDVYEKKAVSAFISIFKNIE